MEKNFQSIKQELVLLFSNFSFDCVDICNYQLEQFSKLKKMLGDNIAIFNIYDERNETVKEFLKLYKADNLQNVAHAELLTYSYSLNVRRPLLYLLDRHKNIIY